MFVTEQLPPRASEQDDRKWRLLAWGLTAIMAASVCASLLRMPIQVTDSLIPILDAQEMPSVADAFMAGLGAHAYFRPLRIAQIQVLFEVAHGHYFLAYRGFHVALAIACFVLFTMALKVRTRTDLLVVPFALTVLTGLHTFLGTVREAYPINHFLEISVLCLMAFVLAQSKGGWWVDVLVSLIFVVASLTLESGLLVWVVVVTAWLLGMRGVSWKGVAAVTLLLGAYLYVRFGYLSTGAPTLIERSTGFGTRTLDPDELVRRFGAWPYGFYAYNVISSMLSVLFSEPRAGVFEVPEALARGRLLNGTFVNIASSGATTLLIGWFIWRRRHVWWARQFDHADCIVLVSLAVLAGNAVISYGYTKDEILSPAGMFYGLAAFAGAREALLWVRERPRTGAAGLALGLTLAIASSGWLIRSLGLPNRMERTLFNVRNEWVDVETWLSEQREAPMTEAGKRLVQTLRQDAIHSFRINPILLMPAGERLIR